MFRTKKFREYVKIACVNVMQSTAGSYSLCDRMGGRYTHCKEYRRVYLIILNSFCHTKFETPFTTATGIYTNEWGIVVTVH